MPVSRLAQFVREWREKKGLSQEELQRALRIELVQYVHKLEKGKIKKPSEQFLRSFSTASGRSIDELRAMVDVDARETGVRQSHVADVRDPDKYQVAFGHSIWAAPLALAALKGDLSDQFQFASFAGAPQRALEASLASVDHLRDVDVTEPAHMHDEGSSDLRDRLVWIKPGTVSMVLPRPGVADLETLSAREVRQLLNRKKVDVIAAPGELLARHRSFLRIATLVDSALGCVMLHRAPLSDRSATTEQVAERLHKIVVAVSSTENDAAVTLANDVLEPFLPEERELLERSTGKALCVAAEHSTIAAVYADEIGAYLFRDLPADKQQEAIRAFRVNVDVGFLHETTLEKIRADLVARGKVLLGFIGWDPQASWMQRSGTWSRTLLQRTPDNQPPQHLTFELAVANSADWEPEFRRAFERLLFEMSSCVEEILHLHESTADRQTIWWLARYFGYTPATRPLEMQSSEIDALTRALAEVRFDVGIDIVNYKRIAPENRLQW